MTKRELQTENSRLQETLRETYDHLQELEELVRHVLGLDPEEEEGGEEE